MTQNNRKRHVRHCRPEGSEVDLGQRVGGQNERLVLVVCLCYETVPYERFLTEFGRIQFSRTFVSVHIIVIY